VLRLEHARQSRQLAAVVHGVKVEWPAPVVQGGRWLVEVVLLARNRKINGSESNTLDKHDRI
jgi:hypothetical protein